MASRRYLKEPPIIEALVDFRAAATRPLGDEALATLRNLLGGKYPKHSKRMQLEATFRRKDGEEAPSIEHEVGLRGYFFRSEDETEIAQFRIDGFTYNRMKPYPGGDTLLDSALRLWATYVDLAAPAQVTRLALRYINRLAFAAPVEYAQYLASGPVAPPGIGRIDAFRARSTFSAPESTLKVHVAASSEPGVDGASVSILVDVDAFRPTPVGVAKDDLEPILLALRDLKNRAFFATLTDKALEGYA
jgi:uncharacterized protein (TIGR04255 family)